MFTLLILYLAFFRHKKGFETALEPLRCPIFTENTFH